LKKDLKVKILKHIRNKTNNPLNCFHPPSLGYIAWIQSTLSSTYETFIISKKDRNNEDAQKCDVYSIIYPHIHLSFLVKETSIFLRKKKILILKLSVKSFLKVVHSNFLGQIQKKMKHRRQVQLSEQLRKVIHYLLSIVLLTF